MKAKHRAMLYFGCFDGIFWGIMASYGSYIVAMALSRGYGQGVVSIMASGYLVSAFAGQFFWAGMCDRLHTNKKIFIAGVSITAIVQLLLYFTSSGLLFGVLYVALGFTLQPMGSILDAWMLRALEGDVKAYAPARGGGSIGYAAIMLVTGRLIARFGYPAMPVCASLFAAAALAVAFVTPEPGFAAVGPTEKAFWKTALSTLRDRPYLRMLLMVFLMGMASAPINSFKISILRSLGGDISTQGLDGFFGCAAQFMVFEAGILLARIPAAARMLGGACLLTLAILITANASGCGAAILASMLIGAIFGIVIPAGRELILKTVDPRCHTTAIGLMDGCYSFLGGTVAMLYAGALIEAFGLRAMLLVCLAVSLVPLLLAWQACARQSRPRPSPRPCGRAQACCHKKDGR